MASRITDYGLQKSADADFGLAAADPIDAMSISNYGSVLAATTTVAAATQKASSAVTSTRAGNVVSSVATFGTSTGLIVISTLCLHRDGVGVYTGVHSGVDGLSIQKDNSYILKPTLETTYASG